MQTTVPFTSNRLFYSIILPIMIPIRVMRATAHKGQNQSDRRVDGPSAALLGAPQTNLNIGKANTCIKRRGGPIAVGGLGAGVVGGGVGVVRGVGAGVVGGGVGVVGLKSGW